MNSTSVHDKTAGSVGFYPEQTGGFAGRPEDLQVICDTSEHSCRESNNKYRQFYIYSIGSNPV